MTFQKAKINTFIKRYGGGQPSLIQVLQDIQGEYRYLPKEALEYLAKCLELPISHIYNVATFYSAFSLQPKGKNILSVCLGTACHVLGGQRILDYVCDELKIESGQTTPDKEFTVERVNCLGACALGPIVVKNEQYHSHITIDKARKLIKKGNDQ